MRGNQQLLTFLQIDSFILFWVHFLAEMHLASWEMVTFAHTLINSIIGAANDLSSVFSWHLDPPLSCQ